MFHLYCTLRPALSPGTLPPRSQQVTELMQALQHRGLGVGPVLSSRHLGLHHGHTGESRGQTSATPVSLGFAGQPQSGGLQDLRLGAARWPLSRWFMGQILQHGVTGLLLAVGMVGQGLPFMFRVCTSSRTIKTPLFPLTISLPVIVTGLHRAVTICSENRRHRSCFGGASTGMLS